MTPFAAVKIAGSIAYLRDDGSWFSTNQDVERILNDICHGYAGDTPIELRPHMALWRFTDKFGEGGVIEKRGSGRGEQEGDSGRDVVSAGD